MGVALQNHFMSRPAGTLDKKGRVCIPANYRQVLTAQGTSGVYVRPHPVRRSLQCFGETVFEEYLRSKTPRNPFSPEHDDEAFDIYAETEALPLDDNGRVRLPDSLIAYAQLGENVTFVGMGEKFEIWDSARLIAYREERRSNNSHAPTPGTPQ